MTVETRDSVIDDIGILAGFLNEHPDRLTSGFAEKMRGLLVEFWKVNDRRSAVIEDRRRT